MDAYSYIIFLLTEETARIMSYSHNTEMSIEVHVSSKIQRGSSNPSSQGSEQSALVSSQVNAESTLPVSSHMVLRVKDNV